jgi:predicted CoA-binding protein
MTSKKTVEDFFTQPALAIVGVSRSGKKFGNNAYKELKQKGYKVFQIHPKSKSIGGDECYPDFKSVPEKIAGVIVAIKPIHALKAVQEAHEQGIKYVWLQQGAESKEAIDFCIKNGINVIHNECILMFANPVKSIHRFHRWIWGAVGKLPK